MPTIPTSTIKRNQKHLKHKDRYRHQIDLGTPKVPLSKGQHQQNHEFLSDWEDAS